MNCRNRSARTFTALLVGCASLLLCTPVKAHAYADPGSGAFLYQAVYAAFLGGTYYFRKLLDRVWKKRK